MGWTSRTAAVSVLLAMDEHRKQAGARVARLREARGWSQEDLAREAQLSTKTINRFENGKHEGRRNTIKRIANALQVTEVDVLGEPPDPLGLGAPKVAQADQLDQIIEEFHARVDHVEACLDDLANRMERNHQLLVAVLESVKGTAAAAGFEAPPIHPVAERILSEPSPALPVRTPRSTGSQDRARRRAS
jgi:transcriptional regulator with XRE-family HTH domain